MELFELELLDELDELELEELELDELEELELEALELVVKGVEVELVEEINDELETLRLDEELVGGALEVEAL